jgi:squalene-associated FAD-dependent desaturase
MSVVVVGGGVAGLAAASALAEQGCVVTLLEAGPALGGRARSFVDRHTGDAVDNGQHALMGCYHEFLSLLARIGRRGELWESDLDVALWDGKRGVQRLACPALPSPLHFAAGVLRFGHLSLGERLSALRAGRALVRRFGTSKNDSTTVAQALVALRQSPRARRALWDPLTWATLNANPEEASACLLSAVVARALLGPRSASRFLLPGLPLSELYAEPARKFVEARGGSVRCRAPVDEVVVERGAAVGVRSRGELVSASQVILAVPPAAVRRIVPPVLRSVVPVALERTTPVVSVTLWLDRPIGGPDFLGLLDGQTQWLFRVDRIQRRPKDAWQGSRQGARLACVRSGASAWLDLPTREIAAIALREAAEALPGVARAKLCHALVVKEGTATLAPSPELQSLRPGPIGPVQDLYLAGDWTDTGLPATLESAALSGHRAANLAGTSIRAAA